MCAEQVDKLLVPMSGCLAQWRVALLIGCIDFCAVGQEQVHRIRAAANGGSVQRRPAGLVLCVHIGAVRDEETSERLVATSDRHVQGRVGIRIVDCLSCLSLQRRHRSRIRMKCLLALLLGLNNVATFQDLF